MTGVWGARCGVAGLLRPARGSHAATITVTSLADSGGPCPSASSCILREALAAATSGDTIQFAVIGTIVLSTRLVTATNVTIQGPGAASLVLDGNPADRILSVNLGHNVVVEGVTIRNGAAGLDGGGPAAF